MFSLYLITILNPYQNINYNQINVYEYETQTKEIKVIEAEQEEVETIYCYICKPPRYLEIEKND